MPTEEELFRAVLERPGNDGPRRRYAAYLESIGDELGEYIRLSLDVDRKRPSDHDRWLRFHNSLRERLHAPFAAWTRSVQRDRGLVAAAEMTGRQFLDYGADVLARAPVQHLGLVETKDVFAEVMNHPVLAKIRTLSVHNADLGDAEAAMLAASPYVRQLVCLSLYGNRIGQAGLEAIAASENVPALRIFFFEYNEVESPVGRDVTDGVSGLVFYQPGGPLAAVIREKYGDKPWLVLPQDTDRFRVCDEGE